MEEKKKIIVAIIGHGSVNRTEVIKRLIEKNSGFIVMNEKEVKSFMPELSIPMMVCEVNSVLSEMPIIGSEPGTKTFVSKTLVLEPRLPYYMREKKRKYYEPQRHPYIQKDKRRK